MELTEKNLHDIHKVCIDLLVKFDELCKKLNLRYTLSDGTLLGAVRNGKIIPWDDDVDVRMPREDYEKLVDYFANGGKVEGYTLQHYRMPTKSTIFWAKFINENTTWIEKPETIVDYDLSFGIWLDIFPVDRFKGHFSRIMSILRCTKYSIAREYFLKLPSPKFIKFWYLPYIHYAKKVGYTKINEMMDTYSKEHNKGKYACSHFFGKRRFIPFSVFEHYKEIELEGHKFMSVEDTDTFLKALYGKNYITPPPESERHNHCENLEILDCEKSYKNYIKDGKICKH